MIQHHHALALLMMVIQKLLLLDKQGLMIAELDAVEIVTTLLQIMIFVLLLALN
jgi:hypothetical protein